MNLNNYHVQPLIMVLSATVILCVLSLFNTQWNLLGFETKKIEPIADILSKADLKTAPLPDFIVKDSIIAKDSTAIIIRKVGLADILDFGNDSTSALEHFFKALNQTSKEKHKTRIAYFGDSMIEGDLISQDLRTSMQENFGGYGVGFVPITSIVSGFRTSVIHSFGDWTTYNLLENPPANHTLGISGYSFVPITISQVDTTDVTSRSWVKYTAVNKKNINKFYEAKLIYGKGSEGNNVEINGRRYALNGTNVVNQISIKSTNAMQSIHARFQCKTSIDIFGFSMESDSGVFVDNFSFRGHSGLPMSKVTQAVYSGTNNCLEYDLIILEYGLNVVSPNVTDFSWYEHGMNKVIKHIKASFPNTSILLVSIGDKSYRNDGEYQTDPSVPILLEAQRRISKDNKIAFWSLYDAMGGNGSMVKWAEGDTAFANRDYTHFNFKGARKVGKLLHDKLIIEYKEYNKAKINN